MQYNNKNLMTSDCLKILKFFASDFIQLKITKLILCLTFAIHFSSTCITAYFFIYVFDLEERTNYSIMFIGTPALLLAIHTLLYNGKIVANLDQELPLWTLNSAGEKIQSRIKFEIRIITTYTFLFLTVAFSGSFLYYKPLPSDEKIIFMLRFSKLYCPFFENVYRNTFWVCGYVISVHMLQILYYTQHLKFQMMLFRDYLCNICNYRNDIREIELFYNKKYQDEVFHRIIFCIKRQEDFLIAHGNKMGDARNLVMAFALAVCFLGISFVLCIFSNILTSEFYLRIAVTSVTASALFLTVIWSGQTYETIGDLAPTVGTNRWYNFNSKNKKLYLIFLTHLMKMRSIKFSENYSINYQLGIAITKGIYSVASVFINMM